MKQPEADLKTALKEQIEEEALNPGQLNELIQLQEAVLGSPESSQDQTVPFRAWAALAASTLLIFASLLLWQTMPNSPIDAGEQIAREVVKNHLKLKPLDIATSSMSDIQNFFGQLDFLPASSAQLPAKFSLTEADLLGGRYCSIKGVTAAQLRYRDANTQLSTLYQVPYQLELFGEIPDIEADETPRAIMLQGLTVHLWVEKGLLMALITQL